MLIVATGSWVRIRPPNYPTMNKSKIHARICSRNACGLSPGRFTCVTRLLSFYKGENMYFISDIKKMCRSRTVRFLFVFLLIVMIASPFTQFYYEWRFPSHFDQVGKNPFQFWLLLDNTNWGNTVYYVLFWVFSVLVTGPIYILEKESSVREFLVVRKGKREYYCSKILSTAIFSFLFFLMLLSINLLVTYTIFPANSPLVLDYIIPKEGSYAYTLYCNSPLLMAAFYTLINAFALSIFSVFSLGIWFVFRFPNKYIALLAPIVILFSVTYAFDTVPELLEYNIRVILQPLANIGISATITARSFFVTFLLWILADLALLIIGWFRNKDILS